MFLFWWVPEQRRIRNSQESHVLILVGSGAKEDKELPESGFLVLVGSGAKEDKKLPESSFLVLMGSGAKEVKKLPGISCSYSGGFRSKGG